MSIGPIKRDSPLPIYAQIAENLKSLANKAFLEGKEKFFTDDELIKLYGVSRMTIRQAVQLLVDEGILRRVQGSGTFLARKEKMETDIERLDTYFKGWYLQKDFSVELLSKENIPCPERFSSMLGIKPLGEVTQVIRLRLSNGIPVVVDKRYILKEFGDRIDNEELIHYSLSHIFFKKFNLGFSEGELEIEAILCDEEIAKLLNISVGSPILHRYIALKMESYGKVLVGDSFYRGDMYKYKSILHA